MGDDAECEFARYGEDARTAGGDGGPATGRRRASLWTSDGVRIEAAYDPYEGGGRGRGARSTVRAPGAIVLAHGFSGSVDRPALRRAVGVFTQYGAVITFSFRGHGRSGGHSTVGDLEVLDLAAAVRWARSLGHARVATVGFSMGGSVVVRHGALRRPHGTSGTAGMHEGRTGAQARTGRPGGAASGNGASGNGASGSGSSGPESDAGGDSGPGAEGGGPSGEHSDAVVAVSAPARWYYRGTAPMRRLHWVIQRPVGRLVSRYGLRTRIHPRDWDPVPLSPVGAAPLLAPTPLLVVHGDQDPYFPEDHPRSLAAAGDPEHTELWLVEGFGHAENAADAALLHRIGGWVRARWSGPGRRPA
ncbi:alpha/beta fold hydrolase [Streptomyces marispadix]|uniref:Alpha/beta hydrolase n=1 Tax=Streptomyces marispadix TaxID=2922868 RepID=A0ABS9SXU8_9ACTN|nr:alpha/beta hydrolase [Streptomyces marispadix]MCH6161090.1 alpha/beta hydrolase [Streptomyces marispadix]